MPVEDVEPIVISIKSSKSEQPSPQLCDQRNKVRIQVSHDPNPVVPSEENLNSSKKVKKDRTDENDMNNEDSQVDPTKDSDNMNRKSSEENRDKLDNDESSLKTDEIETSASNINIEYRKTSVNSQDNPLESFHSADDYPEDEIPADWTEPVSVPIKYCTPVQDEEECEGPTTRTSLLEEIIEEEDEPESDPEPQEKSPEMVLKVLRETRQKVPPETKAVTKDKQILAKALSSPSKGSEVREKLMKKLQSYEPKPPQPLTLSTKPKKTTNLQFEEPGSSDQSWGVKNMSNFWEYHMRLKQRQLEAEPGFQARNNQHKSMPDLSTTTTEDTSSSCVASDTCQDSCPEEEEDNSSLLVPVKDRRKVFESSMANSRDFLSPKPSRSSWPSMPSLTVRVKPDKPQPLPLVGANSRKSEDNGEIHHTPVKDALEHFSNHPSPSKSFIDSEPISQKTAIQLATPKPDPIPKVEPPKEEEKPEQDVVAPYRWDDESNGEIYTDIPIDPNEDMKDVPLYVVENGHEFPLAPIKLRKSQFELVSPKPYSSKRKFVVPDLNHSEYKLRETQTSPETAFKSSTTGQPTTEKSGRPKEILKPIKSDSTPYILQEEQILKNINVVGIFKSKFSSELWTLLRLLFTVLPMKYIRFQSRNIFIFAFLCG